MALFHLHFVPESIRNVPVHYRHHFGVPRLPLEVLLYPYLSRNSRNFPNADETDLAHGEPDSKINLPSSMCQEPS